jgi:hypothetical protein
MDALYWTIIQELRKCSFYPGSYDKRFVRDMETLGEYDMLSPKQAALLERMAWRYRRQIGRELVLPQPREPSLQDQDKLEAWTKGEPIR